MTGDSRDIARRLRAVIPTQWFGDVTPVLDTLLGGLASAWAYIFQLLEYTRQQTRLATVSDIWLDLAAQDFFGNYIRRLPGQSDTDFRLVVKRAIFREYGTRRALVEAMIDLTGRAPVIFEPRNPTDTGGYGNSGFAGQTLGGGIGYGTGGGWGSLALPFQYFVTAFRPTVNGVANVSGWCVPVAGYGIGALAYTDPDAIPGHISDQNIMTEMVRVAPVGVVIWTRISS